MAASHTNGERHPPSADDLLAQWRQRFRAADVDGLTELYHPEAFLVGSGPDPRMGRDRIRDYFDSLALTDEADVEFSQVASRTVRPDVRVILAHAEFTTAGVAFPMRLSQVWAEDWTGWLIASHHASPTAP